MLRSDDFGAFRVAAYYGRSEILTHLWTLATDIDDKKKMLGARNFEAFYNAVSKAPRGNVLLLNQIWTWAIDLDVAKEMLRNQQYNAFI